MRRFVEGVDRHRIALLPDGPDDYVAADNPVRVVDAFVDELDLAALGHASDRSVRAALALRRTPQPTPS